MPSDEKALSYDGLLDGYVEAESYTAPEADSDLVTKLKTWITEASAAKQSYERDWELQRCYLKGDAVARHRDTGDIVRLSQEDSKRLRSRNNMLRPIARSLVGKLAKMIPTCVTVPATSDFGDQAAARVGDAIFAYLRRKEDLDVKYLAAMNFLPWAGNAFFELEWDICAGKKIAVCHTCNFFDYNLDLVGAPCPQCSAQREQEVQLQQMAHEAMTAEAAVSATEQLPIAEEPIQPQELGELPPPPLEQQGPLSTEQEPPALVEAYEGDVCINTIDPRDLFVPPGCDSLRKAETIATRSAVSVSAARRRFPQFAPFIHKEDGQFTDKTLKWRYSTLDQQGTVNYLNDHVFIWRFHERPTDAYPQGRLIHMVNDMIVDERESPYHCLDRVPLYHFGFDSNDGEFWREGFIAHAWHRQRELDGLETNIREHMTLLLAQKWLVPLNSRITAEEITAQTAQIIEYNPGAQPPKPLETPQLPQQAWMRKTDLVQDMRMQASVTEQEQGISGSDPNGRAMAIINAETDQATGPITIRNNSEWRELHKGALQLIQKDYHPKRKITVAGPEGVQTYSFDEVDLTGAQDVQVEEQDGLSRNPAIRFNEVLQLATVGQGAMFINPRSMAFDKKAFARAAKLKLPDLGYDTEATERAAAQQIPYLMMRGMSYQPQEFDDPMIFAEELLGWLRGPGRQANPQLTQAVKQVWMYYQQWIAMQQMPNPMMAMQAEQGASQPGQMSAPGGTPNGPVPPGASGIQAQAGQAVSNADQTGDNLAQGLSHES